MARVVSGGCLLFFITMQCLHIEITVFSKPNNDDDHDNNPNLLNTNYMLCTVLAISYIFSHFIFKMILWWRHTISILQGKNISLGGCKNSPNITQHKKWHICNSNTGLSDSKTGGPSSSPPVLLVLLVLPVALSPSCTLESPGALSHHFQCPSLTPRDSDLIGLGWTQR